MEDMFESYINSRPQRLCKKCGKCGDRKPLSPFEKLPEGCGYEGWVFQKREEIKQEIRKQKELLLSLEIMLKNSTPEQAQEIKERIEKINGIIDLYSMYGSKDW